MRKYYVSSKQIQEIVLADTAPQACVFAFRRGDNPIKCGPVMRVSERGFDKHDDDEVFETGSIIGLIIALNGEN